MTLGTVIDGLSELIEAAREGDDRALGRFVERTQLPVVRLCTRLGSPGEVDDLVQDVYLRAVRALPAYRGDAPPLAWLLSIARRACADHVRRRQRDRRLAELVLADPPEGTTPPAQYTADLVDTLDPDRRDAFVLTQLAGLSYEDAAAAIGCPIGTIRSRVARARADLLDVVTRVEAV